MVVLTILYIECMCTTWPAFKIIAPDVVLIIGDCIRPSFTSRYIIF